MMCKRVAKKLFWRFSTVLLLLSVNSSVAQAESFLAVADIHFNPLNYFLTIDKGVISCQSSSPVVKALNILPAENWADILSNSPDSSIKTDYGRDSNYNLLQSSLGEISKINNAHKPAFVLVLGDMVTHKLKEIYNACYGHSGDYQKFQLKLIKFASNTLRHNLGKTPVYFVFGNNDAMVDDYNPGPDPKQTYGKLDSVWKPDSLHNQMLYEKTFKKGGIIVLTYQIEAVRLFWF